MSAHTLREKTRAEILKVIGDETTSLIHNNDDARALYHRQGFIRGLHTAVDILNNNYKDLNG